MKRQFLKEVNIFGVDFTVEYLVHGTYRPATHWEPEEYPETEIVGIKLYGSDVDVSEVLSDVVIGEIKNEIG